MLRRRKMDEVFAVAGLHSGISPESAIDILRAMPDADRNMLETKLIVYMHAVVMEDHEYMVTLKDMVTECAEILKRYRPLLDGMLAREKLRSEFQQAAIHKGLIAFVYVSLIVGGFMLYEWVRKHL